MAAGAVIGALRVNLGIDTAAFSTGLKNVEGRLGKFGKGLQTAGAFLSAGLTAPLSAFGWQAVEAFKESEKALAAVEAGLKSTGGVAGFTADQLAEMAAGLQKISTYDDDDILSKVTANLLTFSNVTDDVFARTQRAVLDVSARLGTDLQQSTIMLGKALNDPVKGLTALRRVGIQFTADQEAVIKSFVATGQTAKAQGVILDEVFRQFGGQAAAMAGTVDGSMAQARNAVGDAMEAIGAAIAPTIIPIASAVKSLAESFSALSPSVQQFIVVGGGLAVALGPAIAALGLLVAGIAAVGAPITVFVVGLASVITAIEVFKPEIDAALASIVNFAEGVYTAVKTWIVDKLNAVWDSVVSGIQKVQDAFKWMYDEVVGHSWVPDMVEGVESWMGRLGKSFGSNIAGLIDGSLSLRDVLANVLKDVAGFFSQTSSMGSGGGGGGFLGTIAQSIFGSLTGFANGGSFTVGGSGGIDSQLVAFRASPSEHVSVTKNGEGDMRPVMIQVVPSPYFDAVVDDRAAKVAKPIAERTTAAGISAASSSRSRNERLSD